MTRRNVEFDLPRRFLELYAPTIDQWVADAIPGMTLHVVPESIGPASPFLTSSALERNTITLRAVDISSVSGPCLLVEPADALSRRLVDKEEARLKPATTLANGRGVPTGTPITGTFGGFAAW